MNMQVNLLQSSGQMRTGTENTTKTTDGDNQKTVGFFGVVMEKAGLLKPAENHYTSYGKNGQEAGGTALPEKPAKADVMAYINENINKLNELVTDEDYSAMSELGLAPDKETPDTLVTVYERIQIQLAAYCDDYQAPDGINSEKLEKVLGSKAMANAVNMAEESGTFGDSAKAYLLKNDLEPTIENVYMATHSSAQGAENGVITYSRDDWEALQPQIREVLEKGGLEATEEQMDQAKWLMQRQIPVTVENVLKLGELNQVNLNNSVKLQSNIAYALMFGMEGTQAFVTENWIEPSQVQETREAILNVSDEALYEMTEDEVVINGANLKKYQEKENDRQNGGQGSANPEQGKERNYQNASFVRAKNMIVEARLVMTSGSLIAMQKVGINISYTEISTMISATKQMDEGYYEALSGSGISGEATGTANKLMEIMQSMKGVSYSVMGDIYSGKAKFTISSINSEDGNFTASYAKAEMTYEAVGTQVRGDLGDHIGKAFESIDGILKEIGMDVNESTRRAARILGYNQLEITKESVLSMESMMGELDYLKETLTPKTAILLAENKVNIFDTDIRELNQELMTINGMIGADENEDYAKYLWKLEKAQNLSAEDREAYIEMYRTLHMVEKSDAKAIGALTAMNGSFTLGNLIAAGKSRQKENMDVKVDDSFGFLQAQGSEPEEYEEIGNFVKKLAEKIKSSLNAENVEKVYRKGGYQELSLGNLVDIVSETESLRNNKMLNDEYAKQVMESRLSMANSEGITEDTVLTLLEGGQRATMENIISAMELSTPGSDFRKYLLDRERNEEVALAAEGLLENLESGEQEMEAVNRLKDTAIMNDVMNADIDRSYDQVKKISDINRNVRFMVQSARQESYHIPVEISGEAVDIRVSLVHEEGAGHARISLNTLEFGMVTCSLQTESKESEVFVHAEVYCEKTTGTDAIKEYHDAFITDMERVLGDGKVSFEVYQGTNEQETKSWRTQVERDREEDVQERRVQNRELYQLSKSFIKTVKECLENNR